MVHFGCDLCNKDDMKQQGACPSDPTAYSPASAGDGEEFVPRFRISHSEDTTTTKTL